MSWAVSWSAMRPSSSVRLTVLRKTCWRSSRRFLKLSSFFLSMSFDKRFILVVIVITVKFLRERRLDAGKTPVVTDFWIRNEKLKERPVHRPLFAKRRRRKGNLSGKAMHDAVSAYAKTHGLKKSQFLEEG